MEIKVNVELTASPILLIALQNIALGFGCTLESTTPAAAPVETPEPGAEKQKDLSPSDKRKLEISEEIKALGGTPPEKGSVKKFEDALEAAKIETPPEEKPKPDGEEVTLEQVCTLARALVKMPNEEDPTAGKTQLRACLKQVGAPRLTECTSEQLNAIVPSIEKWLGKTLAEVLAAAED